MRSLPDELFLSAGSVGGRSSDTQHLLYGLQHCTLAAAVGARHKVDVGTAGRGRNDMRVPSIKQTGVFSLGSCSHSVQAKMHCYNASALARLGESEPGHSACCKCVARCAPASSQQLHLGWHGSCCS